MRRSPQQIVTLATEKKETVADARQTFTGAGTPDDWERCALFVLNNKGSVVANPVRETGSTDPCGMCFPGMAALAVCDIHESSLRVKCKTVFNLSVPVFWAPTTVRFG